MCMHSSAVFLKTGNVVTGNLEITSIYFHGIHIKFLLINGCEIHCSRCIPGNRNLFAARNGIVSSVIALRIFSESV